MITLYTKARTRAELARVFSAERAERFFSEDDPFVIWRGKARDGSKKYVRVYAGGERVYVIDRPCNLGESLDYIAYKEDEREREARKQARRDKVSMTVNGLIWDLIPSWAHTVVSKVCGIRLVAIESSEAGCVLEYHWWTTKRWLEEGGYSR